MTTQLPIPHPDRKPPQPLDLLAAIPEQNLWLANQPSRQTRRAYLSSVLNFAEFAKINSVEDFKKVGRAALISWRDRMTQR